MLRTSTIRVLLTAALVLASAPAFGGDFAVNGKKSAFASIALAAIPTADAQLASVTIAKGLPKRVLIASTQLSVRANGNAAYVRALAPNVNGHGMHGGEAAYGICGPGQGCSATGTYFLDLDQAELDFPGEFKGRPLVVMLFGGEEGSSGRFGAVTLSAELVQK